MLSAQNFCPVLKKYGVSRQILINVSNTKFHGNLSSGSQADTCGQTDRETDGYKEANRRCSRLYEKA